jgi:hypothetical protein
MLWCFREPTTVFYAKNGYFPTDEEMFPGRIARRIRPIIPTRTTKKAAIAILMLTACAA